MIILGIDTSCDETSAAILKDDQILANIISSQIKIHSPHGGVVPELASRAHVDNLPRVVDEALTKANLQLGDLEAIAITTSPGLIGCLLVGLSYARSLATALDIPLTPVHHLKAHLLSPFLESNPVYPFLGVVVSGGHTALYVVKSFNDITTIGQTVDDACGEAFDKVAKLLNLGYPGGPVIDRLSQQGNPDAYQFTRARVKKGRYYMSYSGLKTAVALKVKELREQASDETFIKDMAASFQKEAIGALIEKITMACEEFQLKTVRISGGVAVNSWLRKQIKTLNTKINIDTIVPSPLLCTDNGAMVAYIGNQQLQNGSDQPEVKAHASAPLW